MAIRFSSFSNCWIIVSMKWFLVLCRIFSHDGSNEYGIWDMLMVCVSPIGDSPRPFCKTDTISPFMTMFIICPLLVEGVKPKFFMVLFIRAVGLNVMAFLFVLNELAAANPSPMECPTKVSPALLFSSVHIFVTYIIKPQINIFLF